MASGAPNLEGQFIEVGQGFRDVLLGSRVFFWVPECFGVEVDDAREGFWSRCCEARASLCR
jgi:hypothetical protein